MFPKSSLHLVEQPKRPTEFRVFTNPEARDNPKFLTQEGIHPDIITGKIVVQPNEDGEYNSNTGYDTWHVKMTEDESRDLLESRPGLKGLTVKPGKVIPWEKTELVQKAKDDRWPSLPDFVDGKPQHKEPERLYFSPQAYYRTPIKDIHQLEHEGLDSSVWQYKGTGRYLTSSKPKEHYDVSRTPLTISVPNDPKYVEELSDEEYAASSNKIRMWKLKPGVIPRSDYTIEGAPEEGLTPQVGYLHIPHQHRDNESVYTEKGINLAALSSSYGGNVWKMTTTPNEHQPPIGIGDDRHRPFSPTQADIFKVDLSKLPDFVAEGDHPRREYSESEGRDKPSVVRIKPGFEKTKVQCSTCKGTGGIRPEPSCLNCSGKGYREIEPSAVVPWEAITGLHSKAEVPQTTELQKRKLIANKLLAEGWGAVSVVEVR
jgi:hypothetical protein